MGHNLVIDQGNSAAKVAIFRGPALEDIVVTLRGIAPRVYELTSMLPLPIKIGYTTPTTLGRDRIAAIAGAWACYPGRSVLVVDAGTAVTYDVLDTDGTFIGGNIASAACRCGVGAQCSPVGHRHRRRHNVRCGERRCRRDSLLSLAAARRHHSDAYRR